jgi:hypothetical protein
MGNRGLSRMDTDEWLDQLQLEEKIEQAGSVALDRLHQLVQRGYRPDFGGDPSGAIWLYHPRESFKYKLLFLYGSGLAKSPDAKSDECCFGREETKAFSSKQCQRLPFGSAQDGDGLMCTHW